MALSQDVTVFCLLCCALFAVRLYFRHGRRKAWAWICAAAVLYLLHGASDWAGVGGGWERVLALPDLLLASVCLLSGLVLLDDVFRVSSRAQDALSREKRRLSRLVDRRVAEWETEAAQRAQAEEALRRDHARLAAIVSMQYDIATAGLDSGAVMDLIASRAQELTHASGALIELVAGEERVCRAACGRALPFVGVRSRAGSGLSYECVRSGRIVRCNDAERDSHVDLAACRQIGARSFIMVPLFYDREIIGVLGIVSPERCAFNAMDVYALQLMAGLIGAAMSHRAEFEARQERLVAALERADRDPLTGLLNHRAYHCRLEAEADRAVAEGTSLAVVMIDMDNFKFFNDVYGHPVGDEVLRQVSVALAGCCRSDATLARFGGDEFALVVPRVSSEEARQLEQRLAHCLDCVTFCIPEQDVAIPLSLSVGMAVFPNEAPTRLEALELADARLRHVKYGPSEGAEIAEYLRSALPCSMGSFSILNALVTAVDNKDRYTRRHSEDVSRLCLHIAQQLGLDEDTQSTLRVAALLHDVGKIGVPDAILRKPGKLSGAEVKAIQQHPLMGAVIVGAVPGFEATLDAVRHHHERWDGAGYPFGLHGEETPLLARIMAVADAFSAMTTDRPYRKGMNPEQALAILQAGAGTQWDRECVAALLRAPMSRANARADGSNLRSAA